MIVKGESLKYFVFMFVFCLASCVEENKLYLEDYGIDSSIEEKSERWICYNPESEMHGKECTESCMERGNPHKFCLLVEEENEG